MAVKDIVGPGFVGTATVKFIVTRGFTAGAAVADAPADVALTHLFTYGCTLTHALTHSAAVAHSFTYNCTATHRNLMSGEIDIGDQVRLRAVFTDPNNSGAAIDPTTVTIRFKDPSGNITSYVYGTDAEAIKEATGIYYADVTIDEAGQWSYKILGTGTAVAADEDGFTVREERTPSS